MKKILTLLAGYAAGMAIAMKYRKNAGTSKMQNTDPNKSKFDNLIEEVVDIHKSAFDDIKGMVVGTFDDVTDFESLKTKVLSLVDSVSDELDAKIQELKATGEAKKDEILSLIDATFADKEKTLEMAREKALTLSDVAHDALSDLLTEARKKLNTTHKKLKTKLEKEVL